MADTARAIPKLVPTSPGEKSRPPQVCIFGRGGWGKTSLIGSLPGRGLVVETPKSEGGTGDTVLKAKSDRIKVLYVEEWSEIDDVYYWMKASPDAKSYQWIAIDTLTGIAHLAKERTIRDRDDRIALDPHKVTMPEWGKIGDMVSEAILKFGTLPLPLIWTAQERKHGGDDDDGERYTFIGPDCSPASLRTLLPTLMLCGRITAFPDGSGGYDRRLRIGPHASYLTKTRAVRDDIYIPQQIRIGTPIQTELFDVLQYLRGKDVALDIIREEVMGLGDLPEQLEVIETVD